MKGFSKCSTDKGCLETGILNEVVQWRERLKKASNHSPAKIESVFERKNPLEITNTDRL